MKLEDQIKAIAELDNFFVKTGQMEYYGAKFDYTLFVDDNEIEWNSTDARFKYLTSRDAIIPVIQRQPARIRELVAWILDGHKAVNGTYGYVGYIENPAIATCDELICATSAKLCEALLRATGKWIN